jgi:hypothetical protein
MRPKLLAAASFTAVGLLLLLGLWLLLHNQTVDVSASDTDQTTPAGQVGCVIAPYDAGLFGNDDPPGGEHSRAFADEVAADCYAVNMTRFKAGVASFGLGLVLLVAATVVRTRPRTAS